jgi:hypothetical protein
LEFLCRASVSSHYLHFPCCSTVRACKCQFSLFTLSFLRRSPGRFATWVQRPIATCLTFHFRLMIACLPIGDGAVTFAPQLAWHESTLLEKAVKVYKCQFSLVTLSFFRPSPSRFATWVQRPIAACLTFHFRLMIACLPIGDGAVTFAPQLAWHGGILPESPHPSSSFISEN